MQASVRASRCGSLESVECACNRSSSLFGAAHAWPLSDMLSIWTLLLPRALPEPACMEWCVNSCDELNGDVATECGACASAAQKCRPGAEGHPGSSSSSPVSDFPVFVPSTSSHDTSLTPSERSAAALVGAFVADAASAGLHWIYEPLEIRRRLAARSPRHPEFHEPPASPAYGSHSPYAHVYPSGASSPYADEVLPLLRSMARLGGFDAADFANESVAFFASYAGVRV